MIDKQTASFCRNNLVKRGDWLTETRAFYSAMASLEYYLTEMNMHLLAALALDLFAEPEKGLAALYELIDAWRGERKEV